MVTTEWYVLSLMHCKRLLTSAVACRLPRSAAAVQSEQSKASTEGWSSNLDQVISSRFCSVAAPSRRSCSPYTVCAEGALVPTIAHVTFTQVPKVSSPHTHTGCLADGDSSFD